LVRLCKDPVAILGIDQRIYEITESGMTYLANLIDWECEQLRDMDEEERLDIEREEELNHED